MAVEEPTPDLNDIPKLTLAFEDITYVYHCAAYISFDPSDYKKLRNANIKGTANIVNLCISNAIKKLCYVSSIATLGHHSKKINEETYWSGNQDQSAYAISKYGAEMEVWRGTQEGIPTVIVNPGVIIGPGFWNTGSGLLFKLAYKGQSYAAKGVTAYVDVKDVVLAMTQLMNSSIENERYILASANVSYQEIMSMICKALLCRKYVRTYFFADQSIFCVAADKFCYLHTGINSRDAKLLIHYVCNNHGNLRIFCKEERRKR